MKNKVISFFFLVLPVVFAISLIIWFMIFSVSQKEEISSKEKRLLPKPIVLAEFYEFSRLIDENKYKYIKQTHAGLLDIVQLEYIDEENELVFVSTISNTVLEKTAETQFQNGFTHQLEDYKKVGVLLTSELIQTDYNFGIPMNVFEFFIGDISIGNGLIMRKNNRNVSVFVIGLDINDKDVIQALVRPEEVFSDF